MKISPIAGALGAEIEGVDLAEPLGPGVLDEIKAALWKYLVLFFRDQRLTPETQCSFTRNFGPLVRPASAGSVPGHPDVTLVRREADAPRELTNFGGVWHSDQSFREHPAAGFTLRAVEIPPYGGDTMFTNLYLAYETLSDGMKAMIDPLIAIHSHAAGSDPDRGYQDPSGPPKRLPLPDVEHPLVRVHPETGRKLLYVSGSWISRLKGMTVLESRGLLDFLHEHAVRPEFVCRFRWSPNAVALLDNRCTEHFAINDYTGHRRIMHRVMFG
jgi:taurine dioxygenase